MATTALQQQQQRLHRTANNVIAVARVTKSSYCDHAGWASKQGSIIKSWKRRYFVLKGRELIYFAERSPSGKGIDEKGRLRVVGVEFTPEFSNGLLLKGELKNQSLKLQLESNAESLEWYARVKEALQDGGNDVANSNGTNSSKHGSASAPVTMQGWLFKEGQNFKTWKKRYMTLTGRVIKYHAKAHEAPLGEATVNDYNINAAKPFALDIFSDHNRIFRIAAESFADIEAWDHAIAKAIHKAPCFGDPYANQTAPFLGDTFADACACEGWLYKRGQRATAWKKRYFTLTGFQLAYSESPGDAHPRGEGSVVDLMLGDDDGANALEIQLDSGRTLSVSADSRDEVTRWVDAICAVLEKDPSSVEVVRASMAAAGRGSLAMGASSRVLRRGTSGSSGTGGGRMSAVAESGNLSVASGKDGGVNGDDNDTNNSDNGADSDSDSNDSFVERRKAGWLKKQGKNFKSWKRRFVVVEDRAVTYFEQLHEAPKGSGFIDRVAVNPGFPNCLDITLTTGRVLRVSTESPDEIRAWFQHLTDILESTGDPASPSRGRASSSGGLLRRQSSSLDTTRASAEAGKGWLMKKGKNFKTWKRRYFVLDGKKLSYASNVGESPLGCGLVSYVTLGNDRPFCIDVRFQNGRILNVAASSEAEMLAWCKVLQASIRTPTRSSDVTEFDLDDNDDDTGDSRASTVSGLPRHSLGQSRASLGGSRTSSSGGGGRSGVGLGRGSSLSSSDDSFDDSSVPYTTEMGLGLGRVSLDAGLPGCSGWLRKEGSTIKSWKLRYFTLSGTTLSYFKSDNGPLLKTLKVCHVLIMRTKKFCLEVTTESGRKLLMAADSSAEFDRWLEALRHAVAAEKSRKDGGAANKIVRL